MKAIADSIRKRGHGSVHGSCKQRYAGDTQMMSLSVKLEDIRNIAGIEEGSYVTTDPNSENQTRVKIINFEAIVRGKDHVTKKRKNSTDMSSSIAKNMPTSSETVISTNSSIPTSDTTISTYSSLSESVGTISTNTVMTSDASTTCDISHATAAPSPYVSAAMQDACVSDCASDQETLGCFSEDIDINESYESDHSPIKMKDEPSATSFNTSTISNTDYSVSILSEDSHHIADTYSEGSRNASDTYSEGSRHAADTYSEDSQYLADTYLEDSQHAADTNSHESVGEKRECLVRGDVEALSSSDTISAIGHVSHATNEKRVPLTKLNPCLVCTLCAGYFVEATTIVECLHTFCKSCIVRYLQTSKTCPTCLIVIHETEPLSKLELDRTMQDIMGVILPHIRPDEERRKKAFYNKFKEESQKQVKRAKATSPTKPYKKKKKMVDYNIIDSINPFREDERINLRLKLKRTSSESEQGSISEDEFEELSSGFIRCSARLTIAHLTRYMRKVYGLKENELTLTIECNGKVVSGCDILKKIFICEWKRKGQPMILDYTLKKLRRDDQSDNTLLARITTNNSHGEIVPTNMRSSDSQDLFDINLTLQMLLENVVKMCDVT